MAKDVEAALLEIFREHGGLSEAGAAEYLGALRKAGRYQRDVY
jgi:sulfite reductase (NADPH) flavoprotein alpha-component